MKVNIVVSKYEAREETFLNYKLPAKIKNEDKAEILSSLIYLKREISNLEALEKRVSEEKIVVGDDEESFIKEISQNLEQTKMHRFKSKETTEFVSNTVSEKMSLIDKMWSAVSRYFSSDKKVVVEEQFSEKELNVFRTVRKESKTENDQSEIDETINNSKNS